MKPPPDLNATMFTTAKIRNDGGRWYCQGIGMYPKVNDSLA
jgi:hypothetical protein